MKVFKQFTLAGLLLVSGLSSAQGESCQSGSVFNGVIFDAGAFPSGTNMESRLDDALHFGVEKVVLFPHPDAKGDNRPTALEESFPDLVVRGDDPWSNAAPVIWPEPMEASWFGRLGDELARNPTRKYLLSYPSRFELNHLRHLIKTAPNLWLGLSAPDLKILVKNCAKGDLQSLVDLADGRVVFSSFGGDQNWQSYKWAIRSLRRYIALLDPVTGEALAHRNAEVLYKLAVNAP